MVTGSVAPRSLGETRCQHGFGNVGGKKVQFDLPPLKLTAAVTLDLGHRPGRRDQTDACAVVAETGPFRRPGVVAAVGRLHGAMPVAQGKAVQPRLPVPVGRDDVRGRIAFGKPPDRPMRDPDPK